MLYIWILLRVIGSHMNKTFAKVGKVSFFSIGLFRGGGGDLKLP